MGPDLRDAKGRFLASWRNRQQKFLSDDQAEEEKEWRIRFLDAPVECNGCGELTYMTCNGETGCLRCITIDVSAIVSVMERGEAHEDEIIQDWVNFVERLYDARHD